MASRLKCFAITSIIASFSLPTMADDQFPVSAAKKGFTPAQAADLLKRFNNEEALKGGDVSLFGYTNFGEVQKTAVIGRSGPVIPLKVGIDPSIGKVRFKSKIGEMTLDEYVANAKSRAQGVQTAPAPLLAKSP